MLSEGSISTSQEEIGGMKRERPLDDDFSMDSFKNVILADREVAHDNSASGVLLQAGEPRNTSSDIDNDIYDTDISGEESIFSDSETSLDAAHDAPDGNTTQRSPIGFENALKYVDKTKAR